jgi:hypothetical protein
MAYGTTRIVERNYLKKGRKSRPFLLTLHIIYGKCVSNSFQKKVQKILDWGNSMCILDGERNHKWSEM